MHLHVDFRTAVTSTDGDLPPSTLIVMFTVEPCVSCNGTTSLKFALFKLQQCAARQQQHRLPVMSHRGLTNAAKATARILFLVKHDQNQQRNDVDTGLPQNPPQA